ncbi:SDR family NAD(P)-dependent oxidoreductase [Sphingomonas psychrolutea]|uniref:3-ketoacyl-ACP reductase n=1 Tax=Sphingomonas psychrolutea TaxID=1259676 RepID=A0ABQ1G4S3_9SPHN|nr:SDR family oxidoreductase [Sphingomonas psychrolutea]GGA36694.1 3-ketoacyl-ACP reductase [Sphingomonas psychrolutea]
MSGSVRNGDVILITGATGAIGFEIAAQAAAAGAIVGVHGASAESVAKTCERLRQQMPDARLVAAPADFRTTGALEVMVNTVASTQGRLDAVIHCGIAAARGITGPFAGTDPAAFGDHAALVLGSFQRLCFAALPHLSKQGGTIIGFASDAGRFGAARQAVIGGAFGGIMSFVRNLALEVARDGVRVHCLSPSFVSNTPAFAAHAARAEAASARAGLGLPTPADIAPMALFLCSPGAARITGQVISINGGLNA